MKYSFIYWCLKRNVKYQRSPEIKIILISQSHVTWVLTVKEEPWCSADVFSLLVLATPRIKRSAIRREKPTLQCSAISPPWQWTGKLACCFLRRCTQWCKSLHSHSLSDLQTAPQGLNTLNSVKLSWREKGTWSSFCDAVLVLVFVIFIILFLSPKWDLMRNPTI